MSESRHTENVAGSPGVATLDAHTPYEVFEREHRVLRERILGLRSALLADRPDRLTRLVEQVDKVRSQLVVHFAFEEDYGFKHGLQIARPAVAPEIDRLKREHKEIVAVLMRVSAGLKSGLPCTDVRASLLSVLQQLANHELAERKLLRVALSG